MRELTLNGKHYSEPQLIVHCTEQLSISKFQWKRDVCAFILEWLNPETTVQAKTSGSTGAPKPMVLSKERMLNSAKLTGAFFRFKKDQSALLCLSTNFIAGKMMVVRAFLWQLNLIIVEPNSRPMNSVQSKIDFAAMVPLQVANSLNDRAKLNMVRNLLIGGGAVDSSLENKLRNITTNCFSGYGMTETVSHVAIRSLNGENKSSYYTGLGKLTFSTDERECLKIDAPQVLLEPICTNDMVELINEKQFVWLGRFDNVVNSGGIKLFPEQIEEKLHAIISDPFFLAGVPDKHLGQKLVLVIEKAHPDSNYKSELEEKIKGLPNKYEQARNIIFIREFKRTPNGKLQREATLSLLK